MSWMLWIRVGPGERVVLFRDRLPVELLGPGRWLRLALGGGLGALRLSTRETWVETDWLEEIVRAGLLEREAVVLDLADGERAIVRVDGRFVGVRGAGLSAVWAAERRVEVERFAVGFSIGA